VGGARVAGNEVNEMKKIIGLMVVLISVMFVSVTFNGCKKSSDVQQPQDKSGTIGISIGNTAQDFTEENHLGNMVSLSEFRGKVILLNFGAMWCGPCRQEAPELNRIYNTYKARGLEILQFTYQDEDSNPADLSDLGRWMGMYDIIYMVLRDEDRSTVDAWNFNAIPYNVIIDRDFVVRYREAGFDENAVVNWLEDLL
jgi:thiol-disulfide isomerase/thioredoxin